MSDLPEFSTKPNERDIVKDDKHSVLVRLHTRDWSMIKLMLKRDDLSFQHFISLVSRAYMDGDPDIIKTMRRYRTLELIPEDKVSRGVFSNRERAEIYAELERKEDE